MTGEPLDVFEGMDVERGVVRESSLTATNDFYIWVGSTTRRERFACRLNGVLPGGWRLGRLNGRWRFFRV